MEENLINLKYRALIQESDALTNGFRAGIRSLCKSFFSKELLAIDLYHLSNSDSATEELVERVLSALQDRVKLDSGAFDEIVAVLRTTTSMDYLAKRLEKRYSILKQEHACQLRLQEGGGRVMAGGAGHHDGRNHEIVMTSGFKYSERPSYLSMGPATTRRAGGGAGGGVASNDVMRCWTEPGAANRQAKSPRAYFTTAEEHANTVGTDTR